MGKKNLNTSARRAAAAILALVALVVPSAALSASASELEAGDGVYVGPRVGYSGTGAFTIYEETPADPANPGEPDFWGYCIEHDVRAKTRTGGIVQDPSEYLGENNFVSPDVQGKVTWIIAHSYPAVSLEDFAVAAGTPGIARNDVIEATQYAIWAFTERDGDSAMQWPWENDDSKKAYYYLLEGAKSNPGMTPEQLKTVISLDGPTDTQETGTLVGPFVVHTNASSATILRDPEVLLTDASGAAISSTVVDGQEFYLDLRETTTSGSVTVTAEARGSAGGGQIISVPKVEGTTPTTEEHAQSIILVAANTAKVRAQRTVQWLAPAAPEIGTTLVDDADGDHVLAAEGGTLTDTIAYRNLTPGTEYTVTGELMRKSDGSATGITGRASFTPSAADGTVDVVFIVPEGYAGEDLVAFEWLFEGTDTTGEPIAEHVDLNDAAQTVTVEKTVVETPEPSQSATPEPTPEPSQSVTPKPTPEPSQSVTPEPSETVTPSATPVPGTPTTPSTPQQPSTPDDGEGLPATGADAPFGLAIAALGLIAVGALVILGRRRMTLE